MKTQEQTFRSGWNVPSVFWVVGGIDPELYRAAEQAGTLDEIPANHAPDFAPVIHPTLAHRHRGDAHRCGCLAVARAGFVRGDLNPAHARQLSIPGPWRLSAGSFRSRHLDVLAGMPLTLSVQRSAFHGWLRTETRCVLQSGR